MIALTQLKITSDAKQLYAKVTKINPNKLL